MLELWKSEQQSDIAMTPDMVVGYRAAGEAAAEHARITSAKDQEHQQALATERQKVELGIHDSISDEEQ